jgi:predicted transcriptional regulator
MAKQVTAIRLEAKQLTELEKIARREDRAVSYIIRKAIDEYVQRAKRGKS